MSLSKQETLLLEERIEKIRKKNEEIKRRYLEVEEDKQNAAKLNAMVQITNISEDWPVGGRSSPGSHNVSKGRHSDVNRPQQKSNAFSTSGKCYNFGQGDGPPPDPVYKFLADTERDPERGNLRHFPQRRGRVSGRSRGSFTRDRERGSSDFHGGRSDVSRPEYEAWRAERIRIDNDRISRQKTAEGHWRREWDNEKITQEDDREVPRIARAGGSRSRITDYTRSPSDNVKTGDQVSRSIQILGRGSDEQNALIGRRGNLRGRRLNQNESLVVQADLEHVEENIHSPRGKRSVVDDGESIKISVLNDSSTQPVRRVKVNAPVVGGTGRVGPRQKVRVSYSSQSEDETPHTHIIERRYGRISKSTAAPSDDSTISSAVTPALAKPPLPPSTGFKLENPKPKRQRGKRYEHEAKLLKKSGEKKENDNVEKFVDKKEVEESNLLVEESLKGIESGGDDSWEDVTTTSGNDSACEELSPCSKSDIAFDAVCNETQVQHISEKLIEIKLNDESSKHLEHSDNSKENLFVEQNPDNVNEDKTDMGNTANNESDPKGEMHGKLNDDNCESPSCIDHEKLVAAFPDTESSEQEKLLNDTPICESDKSCVDVLVDNKNSESVDLLGNVENCEEEKQCTSNSKETVCENLNVIVCNTEGELSLENKIDTPTVSELDKSACNEIAEEENVSSQTAEVEISLEKKSDSISEEK